MAASASGSGQTVTALFKNTQDAERAYRSALELGYTNSQINLVMSEQTRRQLLSAPHAPHSDLGHSAAQHAETPARGAAAGGPLSGTIATLGAGVTAAATVALLPGLVLAGPAALALTAAGAVGLAGGLIAALADWGIPHDRVQDYAGAVREGGILIGINTRSAEDAQHLARLWLTSGGQLVRAA